MRRFCRLRLSTLSCPPVFGLRRLARTSLGETTERPRFPAGRYSCGFILFSSRPSPVRECFCFLGGLRSRLFQARIEILEFGNRRKVMQAFLRSVLFAAALAGGESGLLAGPHGERDTTFNHIAKQT